MKMNVLNLKSKLTLCRWLEGNATKIADMTRPEVLELAAKELGFTVTDNNLTGAIQGAGLKIKFRRASNTETVAQRSFAKTAYTAAALRDLMTALNYPVPAYLNAVISGQSTEVVEELYSRTQHRTSS